MASAEEYPRYQYPGLPDGDKTVFHGPDGLVEIEGYQKEIFSVLKLADGTKSTREIVESKEHDLDEATAEAILHDLGHLGIIADSRHAYRYLHGLTENPTRFDSGLTTQDIIEVTRREYIVEKDGQHFQLNSPTTNVSELLHARESTRNFSESPLSTQLLSEVTAAAYSSEIAPSPSAGGLYPIKLYMIVREGHDIPPGYYQYSPDDSMLVQFNDMIQRRRLEHVLNSDSVLHGAPVIYVISADLKRHPEKYANRGYRYTMLEAGHVAQNIHLACSELGLGSLEYGGFNDGLLARELELEEDIVPLITIGVGHRNTESERFDSVETFASLDLALVGKDKPVDDISLDIFSEAAKELDFYHASAHYQAPNNSYNDTRRDEKYASGTGTSTHLAQLKAIAEAYERYASGQIKYDVRAAATELDEDWLDPTNIRPLAAHQLELLPSLTNFDPNEKIEWIRGENFKTGKSIMVPIDLVLYPLSEQEMNRKLIAQADSSGVAAHTNREVAIEKALLELIERDTIMRNWYSKIPMPRLNPDLLNTQYIQRIGHWKKRGYITDIIDMTPHKSPAAVINVVIRNKELGYPYFVNGAAAAMNYDEAIGKALEEAELGLAHAIHNDKENEIDKENVYTPTDHGIYYLHPGNAHHIDWLWQGSVINNFKKLNDKKLIDTYNPIVLDLGLQRELLHVVRVIEPSLVPISFGFASEYFLHPSLGLSETDYKPEAPHYFA